MMPVQDLRVEARVHALPGPAGGEGAPPAQEHLEDRDGGERPPVPAALHLPAQHEVAERVRLRDADLAARVPRRLRLPGGYPGRRRPRVLGEAPRGPLAQLVEVDVDPDNYHAVRGALALYVRLDVLGRDFGEVRLLRIQWVAQCAALVGSDMHQLTQVALGVLLEVLLHLRHSLTRGLYIFRQQQRAEHVCEHQREHDWHVLAQDVELVEDVLTPDPAGRHGAELLHRLKRAHVAEVRRGVEGHELQRVGHAGHVLALVAAAGVHEEAEGRAEALPVHGGDADAAVEPREVRHRRRHARGGRGGVRRRPGGRRPGPDPGDPGPQPIHPEHGGERRSRDGRLYWRGLLHRSGAPPEGYTP
mmetsp:Transcript_586/g.1679  ORF Transcript_586/g.1679 Transcript_586/m.1679 type:complete len:360 (+) Transcript_586:637-1716(+)